MGKQTPRGAAAKTTVRTSAPDPRQTGPASAPAAPPTVIPPEGTHTSPAGKQADDAKLPKRTSAQNALVSATVPQSFTLMRDDGTKVKYEVGVQDMPRADAEHWFAKAHGVEKNED